MGRGAVMGYNEYIISYFGSFKLYNELGFIRDLQEREFNKLYHSLKMEKTTTGTLKYALK